MRTTPLLEVRDLRVQVKTRRGVGNAVNGASFALFAGETLGIVGESGCGKSMTAQAILGLTPKPAAQVIGGAVLFNGEDLVCKSSSAMRAFRGQRIAMIMQDPMTALNPVFTIGKQIGEPLKLHQRLSGLRLRERALELLRLLRIPSPKERLRSYPHQLSGGMRQRVVAAITLSCSPEVLIADEPTTALDVTVQAAFLALLDDIQRKTNVGIIFITHDFGVVSRLCDRVVIMYAGRVVESAPTQILFERPAHPYTEALMKSVPALDAQAGRLASIAGSPPSIYDVPPGCPFAPRCSYAMEQCSREMPPPRELGPSHVVSCWRYE